MKLGNKIIAKTFDEIIKVLADVMLLNVEDTVTINQTNYQQMLFKSDLENYILRIWSIL